MELLSTPSYSKDRIVEDTNYIIKKLDLSKSEFDKIWNNPNKTFRDYPSYFSLFEKYSKYVIPIASQISSTKPKTFYELEARKQIK